MDRHYPPFGLRTRAIAAGLWMIILAAAWGNAGAANVYKWTDDSGRVHYSETPPGQGGERLDIRVQSYSGPPEVSPLESAGVRGKVVLYTTRWCGVCRSAKAFLSRKGIAYTEFDIERDAAARARFDALGGRGVPLVLVGGQKMRGFSPERLSALLTDAGY